MIGCIAPSHPITFTDNDFLHNKPNNTNPLHLDVLVHNYKVRRVLIDGEVGLNICTLRVIIDLRYLENGIDPSKRKNYKSI